jgi:proline iminopeptidase
LGLEKIAVIGTSYGGMVALSYASRYPEKVQSLVVIATAADSRFLAKAKENLAARGTKEQQAIARFLWEGNLENEAQLKEFFQVMMPLYSVSYKPESLGPESWDRTILSVDAINVAFSGFLRSYNLTENLPKITAPTLVIGGGKDWICAPEFSEDIARRIPRSKLIIFENSGHLIRLDEPDALLEAIADFIV